MKYLFTLLFLIPFTVSAQFSKGTVAIGGNVSYTSILQDSDISDMPSAKYLTINPSVGVFVTPSFLLGAFVQIYSTKVPTINPITNLFEERKTVSQIYGVFARKYFPLSDKFLISVDGKIGAGSRKTDGDSDTKVNQFLVSVSPVFTFLPHEKWGIEARIGQLSYTTNSQQNPYYNSDQFNADLGGLTFGLNYYIGRKAE